MNKRPGTEIEHYISGTDFVKKNNVQYHLSSTAHRVSQDLEKLLKSPEHAGTLSAGPIDVDDPILASEASTPTGGPCSVRDNRRQGVRGG